MPNPKRWQATRTPGRWRVQEHSSNTRKVWMSRDPSQPSPVSRFDIWYLAFVHSRLALNLHAHQFLVALQQFIPHFHHELKRHARFFHRDHRLV
jgi:hypothetical protein